MKLQMLRQVLPHTAGVFLFLVLVAPGTCQSDSLALSSASTGPGGTASLALTLTSPTGNEPAALQWTLSSIPSSVTGISAEIGAVAASAGKSIECAGTPSSYTCFLSGLNSNIIQNGVIATINITVSMTANLATVGLGGTLGASAAGQPIPTSATGGVVSVVTPALATLSCNPSSVNSGSTATCTVTLNQASPAGGLTLALSTDNPALSVPPSVTVPANNTSASFSVMVAPITSNQTASVSAILNGISQGADLTLVAPTLISGLSCSTTELNAGATSACTIMLSSAAPTGGIAVSLSVDNPALLAPASVTVPAAASTANFPVSVANESVPAQLTMTLTATLNGGVQTLPFTVMCPCSVWPATAQPLDPSSTNKQAIEVGLKFTSAVSGFVTGIRFFKGASNIGTHVGSLWSATGTRLASVTFSNETPSGWQLAYFSSPIAIAANTTYVVSYHAPRGHNAADLGYFTNSAVENAPLQALADGQSGPNGVYIYGASAFPTNAASATNYWVDVVFNLAATVGTADPVSLWTSSSLPGTPATGASKPAELGTEFISNVSGYVTGVRFYKSARNVGSHIGYLWSAGGTLLASVTFTNETSSGWQQANLSTPIPITANTVYVVSYWCPKGHYADDTGYFATSGITSQMLYAPVDGQYGPNGAFSASQTFPATAAQSGNYWVDVVFTTAIQ